MTSLTKIKVDDAHIVDMMNIMHKLQTAEENAPSAVAPQVVAAVHEFMQRLTLSDCEVFARDIRRIMDDIIEIKSNQ